MKLNYFNNYVFKKIWNLSMVYFTFWTIFVQFLYYIGVLREYQESVLLLTMSVSFIGFILTYIFPRKLKLMAVDYVVTKPVLQILDLIAHQVPLIILLIKYDSSIKPDNLLFGVGLLLVYVLMFNPYLIYQFTCACRYNRINNVKNNNNLCGCRKNYNIGIGIIILFFILLLLCIISGVFR